jgi:hypothetical protein
LSKGRGPKHNKRSYPSMAPRLPHGFVLGGIPTIPTELGREDGVVVLALHTRTPMDPNSEINGTLYGIKGITPGYLKGWQPWEDMVGTSGAGEEDGLGP